MKQCVGIQIAALLVTLWISYGHPARNKRAGYLFEFIYQSLSLWFEHPGPLPVLRTECGLRVSESFFLFYIDYPRSKITIRITVVTSLSIMEVAHRTYHTFSYHISQQRTVRVMLLWLVWWGAFCPYYDFKDSYLWRQRFPDWICQHLPSFANSMDQSPTEIWSYNPLSCPF